MPAWSTATPNYDVTSYFRLEFIEVWKTAENAVSDGFRSNFSGAAFCLPYQLVGTLFLFLLLSYVWRLSVSEHYGDYCFFHSFALHPIKENIICQVIDFYVKSLKKK